MKTEILIEKRYCGPSLSGNGGYVCGSLAAFLEGDVSVRLLQPPPLETPMQVEEKEGKFLLLDKGQLVAEARNTKLELELYQPISFEEAVEASASYSGFKHHSFPKCFVCGPERKKGDGMRIFAGPVKGRDIVASPWIVGEDLADDKGLITNTFIWAALDCPGAFAVGKAGEGNTFVLGELAASIKRPVSIKEPCFLMAWPLGVSGKKREAASVLFSKEGECIARARAIWFEVPESLFPPENPA